VDGSVQPYALVIPDSYDGKKPVRLDLILHGRNDHLNEVRFIAAHEGNKAIPPAQDFIQLEVFGRGNNAYRWAGETDVFEALESVCARYRIDDKRIVLRGFSMGGAGVWHLGLHYPDRWAAVEAGAGFTETKKYANLGKLTPQQEAGLRIYDSVLYAANTRMVPFVGYAGDRDPQLQASINIRDQLEAEKIEPPKLLFLMGPNTEHKWHPDSLAESNRFIDAILSEPRHEPDHVRFVTYTTTYHRCYWVSIEGMGRLYTRAEVDATRVGDEARVTTTNISRLKLDGVKHAVIDGQAVDVASVGMLALVDGKWRVAGGLRRAKRPGLQGPIDDAFRDAFMVVLPTGKPASKRSGEITKRLFDLFNFEWSKYMRGDLRVKKDTEVTEDDIERYHLVAFGDESSNKFIHSVGPLMFGEWTQTMLPMVIAPNPLNRSKYVVLNSGHTFHEKDFQGTNALLFPRLGDFAMLHAESGQVLYTRIFDAFWRQ
jgi:pimeloyl-ACP methyl ester carboxylesterase